MKPKLNEYLIIKNYKAKKEQKNILNISIAMNKIDSKKLFLKDKKIKNIIKMIYKIDDKETIIRIFGKKFVNNNKKICRIIINNKIY